MVTINSSQNTQKMDVLNKYHPIVYFLVTLLQYDSTKSSKCYLLIKKYLEIYDVRIQEEVNDNDNFIKESEIKNISNELNKIKIEENDNYENNKFKNDMIDIIYSCIDEYGIRVVDIARLMTIKKYFGKTVLTNNSIFNIFIILNLGYFVYSNDEWYKFSYSRNGWELISSHDIAKEINLFLVGKLRNMCMEYSISLDGITNDLMDYLNKHMITYNHLEQLETFFYTRDFIQRIDKENVLRFEDCVYDFNINRPRPGRPNDFCLKSTNYNYYNENQTKISEVYQFLREIFVEEDLIDYVLKVIASSLTIGNKLRSILFFIGSGRNGKTTFTNMLRLALGDYAATPNVSLFLGKSTSADKPSPHMVDLNNCRISICEEPDARCINITGDAKAITGNVGHIKTRSLYKDLQTVYVDLLPIINTNDKLTISNLDNALIDRILVIPFTQRFVNKMNISILSSTQNINNSSVKHANTMWQGSRVQGCAEALIHILIQNYQKDYTTLKIPQSVIHATKNFIMRCDHIARFLEKNIIDKNDNFPIPIDEFYSFYKNWYKEFVSNRSINYSLEDFRMDLIKYNIRISSITTADSNRPIESIVGYRMLD